MKGLKSFIQKNTFLFIILLFTSIGFTIDGILSPFYFSKIIFSPKQPIYLIYLILSFLIGSLLIYVYRKSRIHFYSKIQPFFISQIINDLLIKNEKQYQKEPNNIVFNNILHITQVIEYMFSNIYEIIPFFIFFFVYLTIIFNTSKLNFGILTITWLIIVFMNLKLFSKKAIEKCTLLSQSRDNLINKLDNKHQNIIDLTSFNTIHKEQNTLQTNTEQFGNTITNLLNYKYITEQFSYIVILTSVIIVLYLFYKHIDSIGKQYYSFLFLISVTYFYMFQKNFYNLNNIITYYSELQYYSSLLKEYTRMNYNILHQFNHYYQIQKEHHNKHIFTIHNLCFQYQNKQLFHNLNLKIPKSKVSCIIGKIGSGKSTLLKLLFGIYNPNQGKIIMNIEHKDNETIDIRSWRKYIQYIPQFPTIFNKTMNYNLDYGKLKTTPKTEHPHFIKNIISRKDNNLSGGQIQIISLYRLLNNPKPIILMDEPTSALDKNNKQYLFYILEQLKKKGCTIIIVSHDKEMIQYCNPILNLSP